MEFTKEELEMINAIRGMVGDSTLDEYECLETYIELTEG